MGKCFVPNDRVPTEDVIAAATKAQGLVPTNDLRFGEDAVNFVLRSTVKAKVRARKHAHAHTHTHTHTHTFARVRMAYCRDKFVCALS